MTQGVFRSYLKAKRANVLLFCLFAGLFTVVFLLYDLTAEPVAYACLLCICTSIPIAAVEYRAYYKRHQALQSLLQSITVSLQGLPAATQLLEQDYQDLLQTAVEDKAQVIGQAERTREDMLDYYTLWVHQIKTPIAAMRLLLQAEDSQQNTELSLELFKIEQYVEMVLQYLRMDSSSHDFVFKSCDLDEIVKHSVHKYANYFVSKKIALSFTPLHCEAVTDEKWLGFVIDQLLSNALKYTQKGRISIYRDGEDALVIEDTGIGINPQDLPRVFEKGYTGYNGRVDKKSTGIGLYLCKKVLTKLSHTITISSEPGRGVRVKIGFDKVPLIIE